jgi:hypothetical protein
MQQQGSPSPSVGAVAVAEQRPGHADWPAIFAGSLIASAVSIVLALFGAALGMGMLWPWVARNADFTLAGIVAVLWLAFTYIWSFGMGGYFAGRMRPVSGDATADEVAFRDGANGLVVWAVGVLLTISVLAHMGSALGPADADPTAGAVQPGMRRATAAMGFWSAIILLLSGLGAWWAATVGGRHRDEGKASGRGRNRP